MRHPPAEIGVRWQTAHTSVRLIRRQSMPEKREQRKAPKVIAGEWRAEFLGSPALHLGGTINLSPEPHAIEFSWLTLPALARGPNKHEFAAVVVLMAPAEPVVQEHPGLMMINGLVTMIDLVVTRSLFSDLLPRLEDGKFKEVQFTVQDGDDRKRTISSWSMTIRERDRGPMPPAVDPRVRR
jgi:hypothetical protein